MTGHLSRRQAVVFALLLVLLTALSAWQTQRLRAAQLKDKQALYGERLRAAQLIIENELLAAAALTSGDALTRQHARQLLERSPR